jgi:hypothetical protein
VKRFAESGRRQQQGTVRSEEGKRKRRKHNWSIHASGSRFVKCGLHVGDVHNSRAERWSMSACSQGQLAPPQSLFSCRGPLCWDRVGTGQLLSGPTGPPSFPIDAVVESRLRYKGRKIRGSGGIRESTSFHMDQESAALAGGVHPALNQMVFSPWLPRGRRRRMASTALGKLEGCSGVRT